MLANVLLLGALASLGAAQMAVSSVLNFTSNTTSFTDGQSAVLTWATNDTSSPVTILLRQGPATNLQTVQTLTTSGSNGQFTWTPCSALPNGNNYAFEIQQASQINYFGPVTVQGYSPSGTCSGLVAAATSTSSSNSTSSSMSSTITSTASLTTSTSSKSSTSGASTGSQTTSAATTTSSSGAGFQSASPTHTGAASALGYTGGSVALLLGAFAAVAMA